VVVAPADDVSVVAEAGACVVVVTVVLVDGEAVVDVVVV
jgi:hypothetical protein